MSYIKRGLAAGLVAATLSAPLAMPAAAAPQGDVVVAGALLRLFRRETAFFIGCAPLFEPLATVLIPVHERCRFDAHATLTASAAPRSVHDHEVCCRVVNRAAC